MAKQVRGDAVWVQIDPATLNEAQSSAYDRYKALYREMKASREQFEASMAQGVASGSRMIFGYNFGKLSVAIVADDRKASAPAKGLMSLADYLATQAASGHAH